MEEKQDDTQEAEAFKSPRKRGRIRGRQYSLTGTVKGSINSGSGH